MVVNNSGNKIDPYIVLISSILGIDEQDIKIKPLSELLKLYIKQGIIDELINGDQLQIYINNEISDQLKGLVKSGTIYINKLDKIYLEDSIDRLSLTNRIRNTLIRKDIRSISGLFENGKLREDELLSCRNFGRMSLNYLMHVLKDQGLLTEPLNDDCPKIEYSGESCDVCLEAVHHNHKTEHLFEKHPEYAGHIEIVEHTEYLAGFPIAFPERKLFCDYCNHIIPGPKALVNHYKLKHPERI